MAGAFGVRGARAANARELDDALRTAAQSNEPWLIDAVVRANDP
jgi:thiamine pyrophosphate-dependent acetolactate synthase large subunit-like protein